VESSFRCLLMVVCWCCISLCIKCKDFYLPVPRDILVTLDDNWYSSTPFVVNNSRRAISNTWRQKVCATRDVISLRNSRSWCKPCFISGMNFLKVYFRKFVETYVFKSMEIYFRIPPVIDIAEFVRTFRTFSTVLYIYTRKTNTSRKFISDGNFHKYILVLLSGWNFWQTLVNSCNLW
jgi:hypothetical protein